MSALVESVRRERATVLEWFRALGHELGEMRLSGPRGRQCTLTALSTALSVAIALALRMDYVWWAGISGFMSMQASGSGSIRRVFLRIAGTVAGAAFALVATPWLADDHVAGSLFVFAIAALGILGSMVSRYSYAWLFAGMTANLIILSSLQDPVSAFHFAVYRTMEVTIGSGVAMVLAFAFAPEGPVPAEPARHGWSDLLGRDWHAVMHDAARWPPPLHEGDDQDHGGLGTDIPDAPLAGLQVAADPHPDGQRGEPGQELGHGEGQQRQAGEASQDASQEPVQGMNQDPAPVIQRIVRQHRHRHDGG